MPEKSDNLRKTLAQLQTELQSADAVDPEVRQMLAETLNDIHGTLEAGEPEAERTEVKSIMDRLNESALRFEESHPTIAHAIGNVADLLAQMGI